jgi:DNA-binding response OmpR family regulator
MTKILVAEDDTDIRELIVLSLTYAGYEAISAADGQQAVELALERKPDLILLDVRMPRLNGYQALEQVKRIPELAEIPVVFLSAKGQASEIQTGLDLGASHYILKPFVPEELVTKIRRIVEQADGPALTKS